ncbi:hypothetical protein [Agrococcus casei]
MGWHTDDPKVNFERQCQYTPDEAGILALGRQLERRIPWRERVEAAFAA